MIEGGSTVLRRRLTSVVGWWQTAWARYWRDLAEIAMLGCFVAAGFYLHPIAGLVVLGLAFLYVVVLTGPKKDGGGDASS